MEDQVKAMFDKLDEQCSVSLNNSIRLAIYYKNAHLIFMQGHSYHCNEQLAHAYVYYKRFCNLGIYVIAKHNGYLQKQYERDKMWLRKKLEEAIVALESIKPQLDVQFRRQLEDAATATATAPPPPSGPGSFAPTAPPLPSAPPAAGSGGAPVSDAAAKAAAMKADREAALFASLRPDAPRADIYRPVAPSAPGSVYPGMSSSSTAAPPVATGVTAGSRGDLRPMHIPGDLMDKFLRVAEPNTVKLPRGIETCGVLAGRLTPAGELVVTTVVVPQQEGGPDTCSMTNEEDLFMFCMERDLLTLGWIHTHPRQKCFMSSMDLHTHAGYQTMLPEAVAIVMAPCSDPRFGLFQLTEPHGLMEVQTCDKRGFHPHSEGIYHQAGHLTVGGPSAPATTEMVDMRR